MKQDVIIKITEDGFYKEKPKWKVQLQRDGEYTFFTNFDAKVGDKIDYMVNNEKYRTAKLLSKAVKKFDTNASIIRQVAFKGAIELAANDKIQTNAIAEYTEEFYNLLKL